MAKKKKQRKEMAKRQRKEKKKKTERTEEKEKTHISRPTLSASTPTGQYITAVTCPFTSIP